MEKIFFNMIGETFFWKHDNTFFELNWNCINCINIEVCGEFWDPSKNKTPCLFLAASEQWFNLQVVEYWLLDWFVFFLSQSNSFYKAKGPAGGVPNAYTTIAAQFFLQVQKKKQYPRIKMFEYIRPGWTFHSKGLWLTLPEDQFPSLTLIGSPNFGKTKRRFKYLFHVLIT